MQCAMIYDFDGTLARGDCPEHGLMPSLKIVDKLEFWAAVKKKNKALDGDEIVAYMGMLAEAALALKSEELSPNNLQKHGATIPFMPGVEMWFERINRYAADNGIALNHYIISSGLEEMIRGTSIAKYFKRIFACKYAYDESGQIPVWPSLAINYTAKTQYLFRINKGIENNWDNESVNRFVEAESRTMPFTKMIYFGDGDTDIPAMKMVRHQGGYSLAVFDSSKWTEPRTLEKVGKLIAEERANYVVPADYSEGGQLDVTVKGILQIFKRKYK